jgi:carbonic anhydrase
MHLFEAIIDANHRAVAGDASAGLHPAEFADALPVIALTCIDPRLNAFFPNALALPADQFIWLRNAGNLITGPLSSTMRSLALACAVKNGREIAIIGHTDCQVCKTTTSQLLDKLKALGVERSRLPDNINEFFGMFATERQNVIKACDIVRQSPLIGPKIPVHGLLVNIETGKLEWIVNGYESRQLSALPANNAFSPSTDASTRELGAGPMADFHFGEMKFPEMKIGDASVKIGASEAMPSSPPPIAPRVQPLPATPVVPPKIPVPPPIRARVNLPFGRR